MPSTIRDDAALFDIVSTYHRLLREDPDLTMPVAAIEALILALAHTPSTTVSETLDLVQTLTNRLKSSIPNSISLSAGTDLFQQYLIANLQRPSTTGHSFDEVRTHLIQNGRLFVERAKAARDTIASFGRHFIRDGTTVLTNGGSRVVGALLKSAAETANSSSGRGSIRFRVIYVVTPSASSAADATADEDADESTTNISALRDRGIPVAVIPPTAIAYALDQVTTVFVGAEGVVENGGIISRLGTYQMGMLARAAGKPFYVVSESHKFVRLYPLGQRDLGIEQRVVEFRTNEGAVVGEQEEGLAVEGEEGKVLKKGRWRAEDAVDYTPPGLISGIITESGVLLPSAVSEELIKIWF